MKSGGDELRERREAADLSQQELAVKVGMHAASIGQYERGIQHPRRGSARALDDALDAGGAVFAAFGYQAGPVSSPDEGSEDTQQFRLEMTLEVQGLAADAKQQRTDHEELQGEVRALTWRLGILERLVESLRSGRESS